MCYVFYKMKIEGLNLFRRLYRILVLFLSISCAAILVSSCNKRNLNLAQESLVGSWNVVEIFSDEKDTTGIHNDGRHWENGNLGVFTFSDNNVTYVYTRLDSTYMETTNWDLTREKVKQGFHKVEKYTLRIGNRNYNFLFGDGTSDAEKNATEMVLTFETATPSSDYVLTLVKQ